MDARQESWKNRRFLRMGWWLIMLNPPVDWAAFHEKSQHDSSCSGLAFRSATIGCNWITEGELKKRGKLKWRHPGNAVLNSQTPNCFWLLKYMILTYAHKMIYTYVCIIVYMYYIYMFNFNLYFWIGLYHIFIIFFIILGSTCSCASKPTVYGDRIFVRWTSACHLCSVIYKKVLDFLTHIHMPYCTSWCLPPFSCKLVYDPQWHPITSDLQGSWFVEAKVRQ